MPLLGALSRRELLLFASTFCVLLMTWTPRLSQTFYSGDDYVMSQTAHRVQETMLGQGRFGLALFLSLQEALGAPHGRTITLYTWLALLLMSLGGVLLARMWRLTNERWLPFVVCPLVFIHPYFAELWAFRGVPALACLSLLPAMLAVERTRLHGWRGMPGALLLLTFSLSIYQTSFNVLVAIIAMGALLELGRSEGNRGEVRLILARWLPAACVLPLGSLCYLLVNKGVLLIFRPPVLARTQFLSLDGAPERLGQLKHLFKIMLRDEAFSTRLVTGLQAAVVLSALALIALQLWKQRNPAKSAWMVLLSGISLLATVGVLMLLKEWWPTPRTRIAFAFAMGGHLALAYLLAPSRLRPLLATVAGLLLWGFAGIDQQFSADQFVVNQLDRVTAQKVAFLQEQNPELRDLRKVAFVGHPFSYPGTRVDSDTNVAAMATSWSHAGLMRMVTGQIYVPLVDEEYALGVQECANGPKWPDEHAFRKMGELLFVCF
ncbi:hypothetical protein BO221_33485 [Archangium sp. Cb G35]|uniref:glucosyltransferase domain-containing protein n=1 Tax=Archangium sp. Cb G35 TaxID=1920190 RepID=UPI0009362855|nr:glucosyltransferase domain-containing protein [Archangium sp. Cb G35]OJT20103.1 hypothetical protein BO221_33485 [Archangium sp. Cb G35]